MSGGHLIQMANDIADFFHSEPDRTVAVEGVRNHIRKFWDPRMRQKIIAHWREHAGEGLNELALAAVAQLSKTDPVGVTGHS